jgi:3-deoxy-D-manno-octulosonic-acid transferase
MTFFLDLFYLIGLVLAFPWLIYKSLTTGKFRRGVWRKFTGETLSREAETPCAWFHGVSVGEIHLLRQVVEGFRRRHPDWDCVISTTTDTGYDEARKRFPALPVFYWPLDFSWAVMRSLWRVKPSLIVLAESEVWPNFLAAAKKRGVPVAVINGRLSPRSFRRWRRLGFFSRFLWRRIDLLAVQTPEYAAAFQALGVPASRIHATGSVKYDGVQTERDNSRTQELRRLLGIAPDDLVWIAGSTQAPEEEIVLEIYRKVRPTHPNLRLLLVPRQKDRFEPVAALLKSMGQPFVRRSQIEANDPGSSVVLVDTIGELGALWGLADVAFVGGSLDGKRGGQNMIEPAAYGAAVVFGPHVWNFRDTAARLVDAGAAYQVADAAGLENAIRRLLADPAERARLGSTARELVLQQQGATDRTVTLLDELITATKTPPRAA